MSAPKPGSQGPVPRMSFPAQRLLEKLPEPGSFKLWCLMHRRELEQIKRRFDRRLVQVIVDLQET